MRHVSFPFAALIVFLAVSSSSTSCRSLAPSEVKTGTEAPEVAPEPQSLSISPPFAKGEVDGIRWELRLNRAQCSHEGQPSTYCKESDRSRVIEESGIEKTLTGWVKDPKVKGVKLSYFTFGSSAIADALCTEAKERSLKIDVYLQTSFVSPVDKASGAYKKLLDCAAANPSMRVHGRGTDSWLNHAKIFLAEGDDFVRVTSSSANLSGSGISLHYDNWLFLETRADDPIAKGNQCFFEALGGMMNAEARQDKGLFQKLQKACLPKTQRKDFQFVTVPASAGFPKPLELIEGLIRSSEKKITIAAHKITAPPSKNFKLVPTLVDAAKRGVKISIVFDDDTILKEKKLPGSETLNVSVDELNGFRALKEAGAEIRFLDTNESLMTLMHNKFMIFDGKTVFTGAGNFSSASLNGTNTEQFYIVSVPEIVAAYEKGWEELNGWAFAEEHFTPSAVPPTPTPQGEAIED